MRLSILSTIAAAVMVASAVRPAAAEPIKVGSKNFTEQ